MTERDFRRIVLSLDGATESAHMGHPDFRAHGRIFATLKQEPATLGVVMLTPEQQEQFLERSGAFAPESGAWGRAGCTRVDLTQADDELVGEAVTLAWQNAAARATSKSRPAGRTQSPAGRKTRQAVKRKVPRR